MTGSSHGGWVVPTIDHHPPYLTKGGFGCIFFKEEVCRSFSVLARPLISLRDAHAGEGEREQAHDGVEGLFFVSIDGQTVVRETDRETLAGSFEAFSGPLQAREKKERVSEREGNRSEISRISGNTLLSCRACPNKPAPSRITSNSSRLRST